MFHYTDKSQPIGLLDEVARVFARSLLDSELLVDTEVSGDFVCFKMGPLEGYKAEVTFAWPDLPDSDSESMDEGAGHLLAHYLLTQTVELPGETRIWRILEIHCFLPEEDEEWPSMLEVDYYGKLNVDVPLEGDTDRWMRVEATRYLLLSAFATALDDALKGDARLSDLLDRVEQNGGDEIPLEEPIGTTSVWSYSSVEIPTDEAQAESIAVEA